MPNSAYPENRIQILHPERLLVMIDAEMAAGRGEAFAVAFLRLLLTNASFIANAIATHANNHRVGTLEPNHDLAEISWDVMENPDERGFFGRRIINGGLVRHNDGTWGSHT